MFQFGENRYRVLADRGAFCYWINIDDPGSFPERMGAAEFEAAILAENLKPAGDPHRMLATRNPEPGTKAREIGDRRFNVIGGIVDHEELYCRSGRGPLVRKAAAQSGVGEKYVYRYLRLYWHRGCSRNALLPDYENCGAGGERRIPGKKKLGRPREISPGVGAVVDGKVEKLFRVVIERHLLNSKKLPLAYAHRRFEDMYAAAFPEVPKEDYPTERQLRHFYEREYPLAVRKKSRFNRIEYEKDVRPLKGTAAANSSGPGHRYEIDATIMDVYVLSNDGKRIVGRPTLYLVVDSFSRLIAGFHLGLENPSYEGAMLALHNAFTDKTALCESFGFDTAPGDWPAVGVPRAILADRGELFGKMIEPLARAYPVRIENSPPHRADAKGVVERDFRTLQADLKPLVPGAVVGKPGKKPGIRDPRCEARFTLRETREWVLCEILHRNRYAVLERYDREADMPDSLEPVPIKLWRWGVANRGAALSAASDEGLRTALLPRQKVTLSQDGIKCFKQFFTCPQLVESGWLHRTGRRPRGPFEAAYDLANADKIWFFPDPDKPGESWECALTERSRESRGLTWPEVWSRSKTQAEVIATSKNRERENKRLLEEKRAGILETAKSRPPPNAGKSKAAAVRGIRANRAAEREAERRRRGTPAPAARETATVAQLRPGGKPGGLPNFHKELFGDEE